jgi:hypothetical protein
VTWTGAANLRGQVQKLWDRGELLSGLVTGERLFPRRLQLKGPTSAQMTDRFDEVREWIAELRAIPRCRIEMREFNHRLLGSNTVPDEAWIDSFDDAIAFIGKGKDVARFSALLDMTRQTQPRLLDWLAKRPLRALELAGEWTRLLSIVTWVENHPKPNIYLRQVDIPDVHSKFIESHRGVLAELLDIVLPAVAIDSSVSGVNRFAQRFGFRDKPLRIRLRLLDPELAPSLFGQDISLDAECFARLDIAHACVFITENEINFLTLPPLKDGVVIFGSGYGFEMLRQAQWLSRCRIYYWGDIDTHGFAILDQLRDQFDHVESFLMDRITLHKFESQWGEEEKQTVRDLPRLTPDERALYDDLRDNRIRKNLRLEQERIGFGWVEASLFKP